MPINVNEIIEACDVLARQDNLNVCFKESLKGGLITGMGGLVGGLVLGPPGFAIGGAVGGLAATQVCGQFKPLYLVLQEMSEQDKNRLANHMHRILSQLDITDAVLLMTIVRDPSAMGRDALVKELGAYFGQSLVAR